MSSRGLALVWCAAVGLTASVFIALVMLWRDRSIDFDTIPSAPVVIIGSSLMRYAVPAFGGGADSLLVDGRAHTRLAINGISDAQTVAVLSHVLASGVETVFIEANALAFDFAYAAPRPDPSPVRPLMASLLNLGTRAREQLITFLGRRPAAPSLTPEGEWPAAPIAVRAADLLNLYPLHLRPPRNWQALEAARDTAKAKGVQLILIVPPRSQLAADAMGPQATQALQRHFQALVQSLDLPCFQPEAVWPNDHFIDQAHMNRHGRARFMQELARWWAGRQ